MGKPDANLIEVIDMLSKSNFLAEGDLDNFSKTLLLSCTNVLNVQRANIWFIDNKNISLNNFLSYDITKGFYKEDALQIKSFPSYFKQIENNQIIVSIDPEKEDYNKELLNNYINPNEIKSLLEAPLRIHGEFIGIICIEETNEKRNWSNEEQHFVQSISHILNLTIINKENNKNKKSLETLLEEKSVLMRELNHRVKNNLSVILALIKNESSKANDPYHQAIFDKILQQVYAVSAIHQSINFSENYNLINFKIILADLVSNLKKSYENILEVKFNIDIEDVEIEVKNATPISLIVNEIITNSYKYAFKKDRENLMQISLKTDENNKHIITIKDNGPGFDFTKTNGQGIELNEALAEQVECKIIYTIDHGTEVKIVF